MPKPVKIARILMLIVAGLSGLLVLVLLLVGGFSSQSLALATWIALPAALNLWLALSLPGAGLGMRRAIIALSAFYILLAVGNLGQGDPRGVTNLMIPAAVIILLTRRSAKEFFQTPKPPAPAQLWLRSFSRTFRRA